MAQISELKYKGKVIYPLTHEDAVVDDNGKPIREKLKEISAGGGEGVLLYNTEQTLTDEQKSQVAKNIGQPRERLILEWKNDQAEVLQPTAYDAETGYFTVETMPSWLPTDGTPVAVTFNYIDLYSPTIQAHGSMSNHNVAWCSYISDTQFLLHQGETILTPITTVQSGVDVSKFYLSSNYLYAFDILPTNEQSPTSGIKKFRFEIVGAPFRLCKYKCLWINGSSLHLQNNYNWVNSGSIGHDTKCHFATRIEGYFYVDYEAASAQFTKVEQSGGSVSSNSITNFVNPTLYTNVGDLWGYASYKRCYLHCEYLEHNATVKIWEIIE